MIIEKPYDQLKAVKNKMREIERNLADIDIIVSAMQDHIVNNLEVSVDDLQRKLAARDRADVLDRIFNKEK